MTPKTPSQAETSDDLAHGQVVIVTARWVLVVAGLLLTLWNPGPIGQLRIQVAVVLMLAFFNFYLTTELLRRKPALSGLIYMASLADLAVITVIVMVQGGFQSNTFIFYFPAILAYSVAFSGAGTLLYTGAVLFVYGFIATISLAFSREGSDIDGQIIIARLIILAAVGFCGYQYRRIELDRRRAAAEARELLVSQVEERRKTRGKSPA